MADAREVTIARLGAKGDGVADADPAVYVPLALPGERWRLPADAEPERLTSASQRVAPSCRHFGTCGGCVAQHMAAELYEAWKRDIVVQAFAHRGIAANVAPLRRVAPGSRRRAFFGIARRADAIVLGFREEGSHTLVDLAECTILDPEIVAAVPRLRALADRILPRSPASGSRLVVTRLDHGLDVSFETSAPLPAAELQDLARLATEAGIARLSVAGDAILRDQEPTLRIGRASVAPPPGIFLQAVPEAQRIITDLVVEALPKARHVADLFCGLGTFTFALAERARVLAADGDKRAIAALTAAVKTAQGLKPVTAKARDLFREPLSPRELDGIDAVVFDPPRAGAQAQCERLARSKVPVVVAVSCNPATLARDARVLIDAGYRVGDVTPVDQFVYAPHVEVVAVFRR